MRKVMAICLILVLAMSLCVTAFAAPSGFVKSPSENPAPEVEEFEPSDEDCTADLVITPYGDKDDLSEEGQENLEQAYDDIANTDDLTELNEDLAKIVEDQDIDADDLAVSDLFNIHTADCEAHDDHIDFDITLDADTLSDFVGLMYLNEEGVWVLVSDAKVVNNGEHLQFSMESISATGYPFAIVVEKSSSPSQTGDNSMIPLYGTIMVVSALAMVVIVLKNRKQIV